MSRGGRVAVPGIFLKLFSSTTLLSDSNWVSRSSLVSSSVGLSSSAVCFKLFFAGLGEVSLRQLILERDIFKAGFEIGWNVNACGICTKTHYGV